MKAITYTDWKINGSVLPFWRVACIATQLTSLKVVDKVSKLLNKSDLERLKSHQASKSLSDVETLLGTAWKSLQLSGHLSEGQKRAVFGRYCVRLVLFVTQKQKFGRAEYVWQSVDEITKAFADERAQTATSTPVASPAVGSPVANLLEMSKSDMALHQNKRLELGKTYCNPELHDKKLFVFKSMSDDCCKLEHTTLLGEKLVEEVPLDEKLKDWKKTKREPAVPLDKAIAEQYLVQSSKVSADMLQMAQYQLKLHEEHKNNPVTAEDIGFLQNPSGIFARKKFAARKLSFLAFGSLTLSKDNTKGVHLMHGFTIQPPKTATDFSKLDDKCILCPFWFVKNTGDPDAVNMVLKTKSSGAPCYVNSKVVLPGELLLAANETLLKKLAAGVVEAACKEPAAKRKKAT